MTAAPTPTAASARLRTRWQRFLAWLDLLFVDHGLFRVFYNNLYALPGGLYRSSQPSPRQIRHYQQRYGIKTIINLRGADQTLRYALEEDACARLGIKLINHKGLLSRSAPEVAAVLATEALFQDIEYPALVHCKSGADRAGFAAALYRIFRLHDPVAKASDELNWRYGHFKSAKTGILDEFLIRYQSTSRGKPFSNWLREDYQREALKAEFRPRGFANFWVDRILRRE